ncbi:myb-like protein V [Nilaparvata lugens]|uniref:myb-like protein V n=1 Tax=Nilaparvata lugens TaxID=108931 RepID=UPI00193EAAF1|nr:myb-like protein V [Nilaparvata lugens]
MALEIAVAHNGADKVEEDEDVTLNEVKNQLNHKMGKLNGVESTATNGHSDMSQDVDSQTRGMRSKKRGNQAKSTPTKSKKKASKLVENAITDDDKSENSSSIFSKDTEDDSNIVVDYDASSELVDISLTYTPDPEDEEIIDVEELEEAVKNEDEKKVEEEEKTASVPEATILSTLRERIRFSLSPKKREAEVKESPAEPDSSSRFKDISGRRPLRSPNAEQASRSVFKQAETLAESSDACLKRKADQDSTSYSFHNKKPRQESTGWNFHPFKWFALKKSQVAECSPISPSPRKLHDEIEEEMVVDEEAVAAVEQEHEAAENEKKPVDESTDKQLPEKIVADADKATNIEPTLKDDSVASSKSGKNWSCSVM